MLKYVYKNLIQHKFSNFYKQVCQEFEFHYNIHIYRFKENISIYVKKKNVVALQENKNNPYLMKFK